MRLYNCATIGLDGEKTRLRSEYLADG